MPDRHHLAKKSQNTPMTSRSRSISRLPAIKHGRTLEKHDNPAKSARSTEVILQEGR
jgi:hypothetical protein